MLFLLCAGIGCEPPAKPEGVTDYDREIDGPPCMYAPRCSEDLLEDQSVVAKRKANEAAAAAAAGTPAGAPSPPPESSF